MLKNKNPVKRRGFYLLKNKNPAKRRGFYLLKNKNPVKRWGFYLLKNKNPVKRRGFYFRRNFEYKKLIDVFVCKKGYQYISPPPAGTAGAGGSGKSTTMLSVVSIVDATLAAFCNALLVTLVGSMIPASIMSTNLLLRAS